MKVYLAKSGRMNPDYAAILRAAIRRIPNVTLVEFTGGKYDSQPLMESDYLVVLPETPAEYEVNIGKGLTSQISDFPKKQNIFMVCHAEGAMIKRIGVIQHIEKDWATNWATCTLIQPSYQVETLESIAPLEPVIKPKEEKKADLGSDLNFDIPSL